MTIADVFDPVIQKDISRKGKAGTGTKLNPLDPDQIWYGHVHIVELT